MLDKYLKEIKNLRAERNNLYRHIEKLESRYLPYKVISKNNKKCEHYTDISIDKFNILFDYLEDGLSKTSPCTMSYKDQLLMILVKLRLNTQFENLAGQFNSSKGCTNDIFRRWINLMYAKLKALVKRPDHDASHKTLPHVFRQYFPRLTAIIDCTEIFIDRPKSLKAWAQVYSNYKKHSTVKFLIACTPYGSISFISQAWGRRVSDGDIVRESGFINRNIHCHRDQIFADRGFNL